MEEYILVFCTKVKFTGESSLGKNNSIFGFQLQDSLQSIQSWCLINDPSIGVHNSTISVKISDNHPG